MRFALGFLAGFAAGLVAAPRWFWHVMYGLAIASVWIWA